MSEASNSYAVIIKDHGIEFPGVSGDSAGNPLVLGEDHVIGIGSATKKSTNEEVAVVNLIGGVDVFVPYDLIIYDGEQQQPPVRFKAADDDAFFDVLANASEGIYAGKGEGLFQTWAEEFELASILDKVLSGDRRIHIGVSSLINRLERTLAYVGSVLKEPARLAEVAEVLDSPRSNILKTDGWKPFLEHGIPFIEKVDPIFSELITVENIPDKGLRTKFRNHIKNRANHVRILISNMYPSSDQRPKETVAAPGRPQKSTQKKQKSTSARSPDELYAKGCKFRDGGNLNQAAECFRMAAEQGHSDAQNCLGVCYECGNGVKPDARMALEWYAKSAEQDNAKALFNLGRCFENGIGCDEIDLPTAKECYAKALELGYKDAEYPLYHVKELLKQRNQPEADTGIPWGSIAKGAAAVLVGGALAFADGLLSGSKSAKKH